MKPPKIRIPSEALLDIRTELIEGLGRSVPSFLNAALTAYPDEASDDAAVGKFIDTLTTGTGPASAVAIANRYRSALEDYKDKRSQWLPYYQKLRRL